MELIIAFLAGAIGGNLAGWIFSKRRIGLLTSTLIGTFGGGLLFLIANTIGEAALTVSFGNLMVIVGLGILGGVVAFVSLGWVAPQVAKAS